MRVFIDTNIWAYRFDQRELGKRTRIEQWLRMCHILAETQQLVPVHGARRSAAPVCPDRFIQSGPPSGCLYWQSQGSGSSEGITPPR